MRIDRLASRNVRFAGRLVELRPPMEDRQLRIGVIPFTEAGHEIAGLIDKQPQPTYTEALKAMLDDASVEMIDK